MGRFLVTGGCGFIGSHLCDTLLARGHRVRVLDDLSTGSLGNLAPGAELVQADICDPAAMAHGLDGADGVFHLAAVASVDRGLHEWRETHRVNLGGTIAVFDGIRRLPVPMKVVYASSAAVYGESRALPISETAEKRPVSAYGADKLGSELHAFVATRVHGIPTTGLRFFNVYGPRQDPRSPYSGVISIFVDRLLSGQPVTIFGDGQQTRDFVFVTDVVSALLRAMESEHGSASVLNICSERSVSIRELVDLIAELTGVRADIKMAPPRRGEIRHSVGSAAAARKAIGMPEPTTLRAGLLELIDCTRRAWLAARPAEFDLMGDQPQHLA